MADQGSTTKLPLNLDMSKLRIEERSKAAGVEGAEHDMGGEDIAESPRAASEKVLATPRHALERGKRLFVLAPEEHGGKPVELAWGTGANGPVLATYTPGADIRRWSLSGKPVGSPLQLPAPAAPMPDGREAVFQYDAEGKLLILHLPGAGIWVCSDAEGVQPVATSGQSASIAFVRWSATEPGVLGCGSDKGDIYLYSHRKGAKAGLEKQGRGRHPSIVAIPGITHADNQITCGDWLQSGALALASGARLKVSAPISDAKLSWRTFSKFKVHKMQNKIPQDKVRDDSGPYQATPSFVRVSRSDPPFIAMNLGRKVMTVMDYAAMFKEEGFFVPQDYGAIVAAEWLRGEVLLIGLSNGYVLTVLVPVLLIERANPGMPQPPADADSARRPRALITTRVFESYLSAMSVSPDGKRIAVLGDTHVKELTVVPDEKTGGVTLDVAVEFNLPFVAGVGTYLRRMCWGPRGVLAVSSSAGHVIAFQAADPNEAPPPEPQERVRRASESTASGEDEAANRATEEER